MKAETKAKLKKITCAVGRFIKDWGLPIFAGATVGAAWKGHIKSERLEKQLAATIKTVENNAQCQVEDRQRMLELERQQNLLFERALKETEGKTD